MLEPAIDTGGPTGRMVLTVLGMVAEMELGSSAIGNVPASTPQRRRGFTRAARPLSTAHASYRCARKEWGPPRSPRQSDRKRSETQDYGGNWRQPATKVMGFSLVPLLPSRRRRGIVSVMTHRLLLESLPVSPNVSRLRAEGKIIADMTSVWIGFGAIELKREVRLAHRRFPNGGSWSFFLCPRCDRRVRRLRLNDGRPMCSYCCGNFHRISYGSPEQRGRRGNGGSRNCAS